MLCVNGTKECDGCGMCETRKEVTVCDECGDPLYEGEEAYVIGGNYYCESCISDAKQTIGD